MAVAGKKQGVRQSREHIVEAQGREELWVRGAGGARAREELGVSAERFLGFGEGGDFA